jgi:hypothetical protein
MERRVEAVPSGDAALDATASTDVSPDSARALSNTPVSIVCALPGASLLRASFAAYETLSVPAAGAGAGPKDRRRFTIGDAPAVASGDAARRRARPEFVVAAAPALPSPEVQRETGKASAEPSSAVRRKLFLVRGPLRGSGEMQPGGAPPGSSPAKRPRVGRPEGFVVTTDADRTQPDAYCNLAASARRANKPGGPLQSAVLSSLRHHAENAKDAIQVALAALHKRSTLNMPFGGLLQTPTGSSHSWLADGCLVLLLERRRHGAMICKCLTDAPARSVCHGDSVALFASIELDSTENGECAVVLAPWTLITCLDTNADSQLNVLCYNSIIFAPVVSRLPMQLAATFLDRCPRELEIVRAEADAAAVTNPPGAQGHLRTPTASDMGVFGHGAGRQARALMGIVSNSASCTTRYEPKQYSMFADIPLHEMDVLLTVAVLSCFRDRRCAVVQDSNGHLGVVHATYSLSTSQEPVPLGRFRVRRRGIPARTLLRLCRDLEYPGNTRFSSCDDVSASPVFIQIGPVSASDGN